MPDSTISLKVTHAIEEFTITRPFPSSALLSTPPSLLSLLMILTVVTCFGQQSLPPRLSTPSSFLLWFMLGTKSKYSTDFIPIADRYQVIQSALSFALSFASHVHEQSMEISDKVAQNNTNHGIRADDRNKLNTFNVGDVQNCMLVVLIHFKP